MTQELEFTKSQSGDCYEALVTVNANYAVHLERECVGYVQIYHTSIPDTKYGEKYTMLDAPETWDEDFDNIVYPKYLRIVSSSMVQKGYVKEKED